MRRDQGGTKSKLKNFRGKSSRGLKILILRRGEDYKKVPDLPAHPPKGIPKKKKSELAKILHRARWQEGGGAKWIQAGSPVTATNAPNWLGGLVREIRKKERTGQGAVESRNEPTAGERRFTMKWKRKKKQKKQKPKKKQTEQASGDQNN